MPCQWVQPAFVTKGSSYYLCLHLDCSLVNHVSCQFIIFTKFFYPVLHIISMATLQIRVYPFTGLDYWTEVFSVFGQVPVYF